MPCSTKLKELIDNSQQRVAISVNAELTLLYWRIGKILKQNVLQGNRGAYGERLVATLATELTQEFGKGWSSRHLHTCLQMADTFPDEAILHTLCAQLSWSHFKQLISVTEPLKRDFYAQLTGLHRWSVRELARQIDAMLHERTAVSRKPETEITQELAGLRETNQLSPDFVFRDTYVLDFLGLAAPYSEATLEQAIVGRVQEFILEIGQGFSFLERQKRISVDDTDYYLDLLFYHRKLRRLVAIDLKIGKFKPEYKGQMELYLRWLDRHRPAGGRAAAHWPAAVQRGQHRAHRAAAPRPALRHLGGPLPHRIAVQRVVSAEAAPGHRAGPPPARPPLTG